MIGGQTVYKRNKQPKSAINNTKRILSNGSRSTPAPEHRNAYLDDDDDDLSNGHNIKTLTKEDFEETIKLLSNNKVNNLNIWDVSIIDYFHDLNQLKTPDGKSINFQMASTTLDGCTKVFSKRLDSIVVDADKVLQMVSFHDEKSNKKKKSRNDSDDDDDDDKSDDDYSPVTKKKNLKKNEGEDENLSTMSKLRVSDNQLMFGAIDPVFRKMLSDFDEAGSGSLLLNSLRISPESKVILDDAVGTNNPIYDLEDALKNVEMSMIEDGNEDNDVNLDVILIKNENQEEDVREEYMDIDMNDEGKTFRIKDTVTVKDEDSEITNRLLNNFKNILKDPDFESIKLCNELTDIKASILDFEFGKSFISKMNEKIENENDYNDDILPEFNDDFDYDIDNFDLNKDTNNHSAANLTENTDWEEFQSHHDNDNDNDIPMSDADEANEDQMNERQMFMMSRLDERINKNRKKSHWKIRAINSNANIMKSNIEPIFSGETEQSNGTTQPNSKRVFTKPPKVKNQYAINFLDDSLDKEAEELFKRENLAPTAKSKLIDYKLKTTIRPLETTIPDLKVWSSKMLVTAEIKPKRRFRNIFSRRKTATKADLYADGEFWAAKYNDKNNLTTQYMDDEVADYLHDVMDKKDNEKDGSNELSQEIPDYGIDNDPGVYDFDAPRGGEEEATAAAMVPKEQTRPSWHRDSIKYEKRSKRINVRALKQNLWDATKEEVYEHKQDLKLSEIVQKTYDKYEGGREKSDLSTSFFFICMLHIANEEGLSIEKTDDLSDLIIHTTSATPIEELEN